MNCTYLVGQVGANFLTQCGEPVAPGEVACKKHIEPVSPRADGKSFRTSHRESHREKTSSSKIVALDLDGVLLNMAEAWSNFFEGYLGRIIREQQIVHWDLKEAFGVDQSTLSNLWKYTWQEELQPYPGAQAFVETLKSQGYIPLIVSNRSSDVSTMAGVRDITRSFPGVSWRFVSRSKAEATEGARCLLDDKPQNLWETAQVCEGFLLDRPWNKGLDLESPWNRVFSYEDFLEQL